MGVRRLILGREVSIQEAGKIKKATGLEVELFVHGSMCMAFSGNCVISNFTQGRDSNRGGCAQSCRFE
jgi:putative protease